MVVNLIGDRAHRVGFKRIRRFKRHRLLVRVIIRTKLLTRVLFNLIGILYIPTIKTDLLYKHYRPHLSIFFLYRGYNYFRVLYYYYHR